MKKYIFGFIILLIVSCAPKKVIQQSKTEQITAIENAISDTNKSDSKEIKTKVEVTDTGTETTVKETDYDTSKPTVAETGKPPVIKETTTTTKKTENKNVKTDSDKAGNQLSTHTDNSSTDATTKAEATNKEIPKAPAVKYWFFIILIAIAGAGSFLVYRNWTRIKTILGIAPKI